MTSNSIQTKPNEKSGCHQVALQVECLRRVAAPTRPGMNLRDRPRQCEMTESVWLYDTWVIVTLPGDLDLQGSRLFCVDSAGFDSTGSSFFSPSLHLSSLVFLKILVWLGFLLFLSVACCFVLFRFIPFYFIFISFLFHFYFIFVLAVCISETKCHSAARNLPRLPDLSHQPATRWGEGRGGRRRWRERGGLSRERKKKKV